MLGKFIVIDGCDGTGKSSLIQRLHNDLQQSGKSVYITKEPTDGQIGSHLQAILRGEHDFKESSLCLLFTADRIEHQSEIISNLQSHDYVICDRYYHATMVYQSTYTPSILDNIKVYDIKIPDLTLLLDADLATIMSRISARCKEKSIFETEAKLRELLTRYRSLKSLLDYHENIHILNAMLRFDDVAQSALTFINELSSLKSAETKL